MAAVLVVLLSIGSAPVVSQAQAPPPAPPAPPAATGSGEAIGATPPRLGYVQGPVSFWRPGASDWAPAQVNTPLAAGDELYTGHEGIAEFQVGGRAYVRAWGDTQLGLANHEPDFLQLKVTTGHATLDLRGVEPGRTVEIDTPHAAFSIETAGYYRVDVTADRTSFITRRGGRAAMTPAGGQPVAIAASEEVVVEGGPTPTVRSFAAPELDVFDRWNYARTDELLESVSARYVPSQVYGADDLDHHGTWRVVPTYGSIWVPQAVPVGWAPYSTGRWVWDPIYGWTWVDTAPWGWAPYHYGRWVFVDGYWAWAPGPLVARPVYAPALVAFFAAPGVSVQIGSPFVSWVALGWGEPVVPWWGRPGFVGRPYWGGWGGPRVVNNVVVNNTTIVNVTNINVYRNTTVNNAVVAVRRDGFGRRAVSETRLTQVDVHKLRPLHGRLDVKPEPVSFVASGGAPLTRPTDKELARPVVATRPPARHGRENLPPALRDGPVGAAPTTVKLPEPKIVPAPKAAQKATVPPRPALGTSDVERPRRPEPPHLEATPRPQGGAAPVVSPREDKAPREERTPRDERAQQDDRAPRGDRGQRDDRPRRDDTPGTRGDTAAPGQGRREMPPRADAPSSGARERDRDAERATAPRSAPPVATPPQSAPPGATPPQGAPPAMTQRPQPPAPAVTPPQRPQPAPPFATPPQRPQPAPPATRPQPQQEPGRPDRPLPGEPANRVFPGRSDLRPRPSEPVPAISTHAAPVPRQAASPRAAPSPRQATSPHATPPTPQRGAFSADRGRASEKPAVSSPQRGRASRNDEHDARKGPRR
jgi:hypothetical protein